MKRLLTVLMLLVAVPCYGAMIGDGPIGGIPATFSGDKTFTGTTTFSGTMTGSLGFTLDGTVPSSSPPSMGLFGKNSAVAITPYDVTGSSGSVYGLTLVPTLRAEGNLSSMVGLYVHPSFIDDDTARTITNVYGLRVYTPERSGAKLIGTTVTSGWFDAPTWGGTNYAFGGSGAVLLNDYIYWGGRAAGNARLGTSGAAFSFEQGDGGGYAALYAGAVQTDSYTSTSYNGITKMGTTGGLRRTTAEAVASITNSASVTITLNIPSGARLLGAQLRVDTALTAGENWDAAFTGGSTTALCSNIDDAKSQKCNKLIVDEIASDVTNIAITKNGGGAFTAAGSIRAIAYYEMLIAMADAP